MVLGAELLPRPEHDPLGLVGRTPHQVHHLRRALAPAAQHVRRDDVRVGRVGPPDADPDPVEVRAAEVALERPQAVVAGQAATEPGADVAEREVDLVVDDEQAVEAELERAARGADRAAGLVHVGLRAQDCHAPAAGTGAALAQLTREFLLGLRELPAAGELLRDLEADVVRALGVARARVAEPDDEPVDGRRAEEAAQDSSEAESAFCSASSPVSPSGAVNSLSRTVAFICMPETSKTIESGMSPGSASMLSSRVSWLSTPPSTTPGASSAPVSSSTTVVWIVSDMFTRRRSTWTASPRTG